jgi:hypothetical protein
MFDEINSMVVQRHKEILHNHTMEYSEVSVTKTVGFKNQMASSLHDVSYQEIHHRSLPCQLSSFDFQKSSEKQKYDLTIVPIVMVNYFSVGVR